jgi:hypothetical protein
MARVTVRIGRIPLTGSNEEMFPHGKQLIDGWSRRALSDVQKKLWADSRFKKATGRSRKAWRVVTDFKTLGMRLENDATNKGGDLYAQFVHLAGTPKSNRLVLEVQAHMDTVIGPGLLGALGRDFRAGLKTRKPIVRVS